LLILKMKNGKLGLEEVKLPSIFIVGIYGCGQFHFLMEIPLLALLEILLILRSMKI